MKEKPTHAAYTPPEYPDAVVTAIQALQRGEADADQQRRTVKWIVEDLCRTYDLSFRPGATGDRETVFAEGKRFVGLQLVKLLHLNIGKIREKLRERGEGNE